MAMLPNPTFMPLFYVTVFIKSYSLSNFLTYNTMNISSLDCGGCLPLYVNMKAIYICILKKKQKTLPFSKTVVCSKSSITRH